MKTLLPILALSATLAASAALLASPTFAAPAASADAVTPALIGTQVPTVEVRDADGQPFDLKAAVAKAPTILVFYRGGWCPYCNAQLAGLAKSAHQLKEMGYQIIGVSPDSPAELKKTIGKNQLDYTLISDSKAQLIDAMGLGFTVDAETIEKYKGYGIDLEKSSGETHHILPVPAVYLVDQTGLIKFSYVNPNYKVRLESGVLMAAAKAYK